MGFLGSLARVSVHNAAHLFQRFQRMELQDPEVAAGRREGVQRRSAVTQLQVGVGRVERRALGRRGLRGVCFLDLGQRCVA
jgi:hypothetical protein